MTSTVALVVEELSRIRQENYGAGISAPQIGELLCIINFVYRGLEVTVLNPTIRSKKGAVWVEEGCLSVPGFVYRVRRPESLTLFGQDRHGVDLELKCTDSDAHVAEHEIDHLKGILIDAKGLFIGPKEERKGDKLAWS